MANSAFEMITERQAWEASEVVPQYAAVSLSAGKLIKSTTATVKTFVGIAQYGAAASGDMVTFVRGTFPCLAGALIAAGDPLTVDDANPGYLVKAATTGQLVIGIALTSAAAKDNTVAVNILPSAYAIPAIPAEVIPVDESWEASEVIPQYSAVSLSSGKLIKATVATIASFVGIAQTAAAATGDTVTYSDDTSLALAGALIAVGAPLTIDAVNAGYFVTASAADTVVVAIALTGAAAKDDTLTVSILPSSYKIPTT